MSERILVERRYDVLGDVERRVTFAVTEPVEEADGFGITLRVADGDAVREYRIAACVDGWNAVESALRLARTLIVRMHETYVAETIMVKGERSAGWL